MRPFWASTRSCGALSIAVRYRVWWHSRQLTVTFYMRELSGCATLPLLWHDPN